MAKRFTDTDKWKKGWFSELTPEMKLLWIYILDNCDSSGIWDINFKLAEFQIGLPLDRNAVKEVFKKQYIAINDSKWFIKDFIEFQYKCSIDGLNPLNKAHIPVINMIEKYKLKGACKGHTRGLQASMDKDKDKEKDKELDKDKEKDIIDDLNLVLGTSYKPNGKATRDAIQARLNEGFAVDDFKTVHRKMVRAWGADAKMCKFLRPYTLYSNKFESYLNYKEITTTLTETGIKAYIVGQSWLKKQEAIDVR